jgi:serine/threonine protein kinase
MAEVDDQLAVSVRARVGMTVCGGKYTIDRVLGIGGMAAVYAGTHRNGRPVAIKLLHPEFSRHADIRKRFLREGQAANAVQHRGVVAVIDDDVGEDGAAFLVMERLEGKTLEQLWEELDRRLPTRAVLAIARELCEILAVAHRSGIIHRDLKPENLFLTNDGELKVLDFGLAQLRVAARPTDTQAGMVIGSPAFMPWEQASGQTSKIDARTDLWTVGATMFTLLSGELVHNGESAQHFVMLAATEPARSLGEVMPRAHPALVALVDRALARERARRWQSAESMRDAIVSLSELLLGEPETPLMTPLALQQMAASRRAKARRKPETSNDDSTIPRVLRTAGSDSTDETEDELNGQDDQTATESTHRRAAVGATHDSDASDDSTRVGMPDFGMESEDTEPSGLMRVPFELTAGHGRDSGDAADDDSSGDGATQPRATPDSSRAPRTQSTLKRESWSDLRQAVERAKTIEPPPHSADSRRERRRAQALIAGPSFARTQSSPPSARRASASAHRSAARPSTPSMPASFAISQERASVAGMVPMPGAEARTVRTRPFTVSMPYLPILLAALLLGLPAIAYVAARGCGGGSPSEAETVRLTPTPSVRVEPATTLPSTPSVSAPRSQTQPEPSAASEEVPPSTSAAPSASSAPPSQPVLVPPNPSSGPEAGAH